MVNDRQADTLALRSAGFGAPYMLPRYYAAPADSRHYFPGRYYNRGTENQVQAQLEYLVVHNTEAYDSVFYLSTDPGTADQKSVNTLVRRDGTLVYIVKPLDTAWHVGKAKPPYSNTNCAGIEIENLSNARTGRREPYPWVQMSAAAYWLATMRFSFGLPGNSIVRHGDIAIPWYGPTDIRNRRVDPSFFSMQVLTQVVDQWFIWMNRLPQLLHKHVFV